jgi:hypothetical protein
MRPCIPYLVASHKDKVATGFAHKVRLTRKEENWGCRRAWVALLPAPRKGAPDSGSRMASP